MDIITIKDRNGNVSEFENMKSCDNYSERCSACDCHDCADYDGDYSHEIAD